MAIFVLTDDVMTDKTDCFTSCACAWGNNLASASTVYLNHSQLKIILIINPMILLLVHACLLTLTNYVINIMTSILDYSFLLKCVCFHDCKSTMKIDRILHIDITSTSNNHV